jgi:uncharacterized membrane protein (DUF4010 family)
MTCCAVMLGALLAAPFSSTTSSLPERVVALILTVSLVFAIRDLGRHPPVEATPPKIPLRSPFSLQSALKFGLIFSYCRSWGRSRKMRWATPASMR